MIQVGKKYSVVNPRKAETLGLTSQVGILREENGKFLGDNGDWYFENGKHVLEYHLVRPDAFDLKVP